MLDVIENLILQIPTITITRMNCNQLKLQRVIFSKLKAYSKITSLG